MLLCVVASRWPWVCHCPELQAAALSGRPHRPRSGDTAPPCPLRGGGGGPRGHCKHHDCEKSQRKAAQTCDTTAATLVGLPETFPHLRPGPALRVPPGAARLAEAQPPPPPRAGQHLPARLHPLTGGGRIRRREWRDRLHTALTRPCLRSELACPEPRFTRSYGSRISECAPTRVLTGVSVGTGAGGRLGTLRRGAQTRDRAALGPARKSRRICVPRALRPRASAPGRGRAPLSASVGSVLGRGGRRLFRGFVLRQTETTEGLLTAMPGAHSA